MNPVYAVGGLAAAGALAYCGYALYGAGQASVRAEWDRSKLVWAEQRSALEERVRGFERGLPLIQKELDDARSLAETKAAELLALQRARADTAVAGLRDANRSLAERIAPKSDDSAALVECKAVAAAYRDVFGACVDRYRELGERAQEDQSRRFLAGQQCERSYDAVEAGLRELSER